MELSRPPQSIMRTMLCASIIGSAVAVPDLATGSREQAEPEERRTVGIFQKLAPATLFLSVTYDSAHPLESLTKMGVGAGFIVDDTGRALTNAHVVDGASTVTATLYDGQKVKAELLGWDPISDVAVLQLEKHDSPFIPVTLGDSSQLLVGQHVLVVGSPFGLGFTLTSGIISGLGPGTSVDESTNKRLVQTTAPINPGNSGGPLVDSHGRVIGMTTATLMGAQNIGFAIPINVAKDVMAKLRDQGTIERPWLGITGQFVTDEVQRLFALPLAKGLLVVDVDDGGPAVDVGLRSGTLHVTIEGQGWVLGGDIIVSVGGQRVPTAEAFIAALNGLHVGQKVAVEVARDGERLQGSIIIGERPVGSLKSKNGPSQQVVGGMLPGPMGGMRFSAMSF